MKFRVIQSNNRGLITKVGDKTFYSRKPKRGEEKLSLPTLFIWTKKTKRLVARCWTSWTGESLNEDFIYEVTDFRDVIDITGQSQYHQWSSQMLRIKLWEMKLPKADLNGLSCPEPKDVWEGNRNKSFIYLKRRKDRIYNQTPQLSKKEKKDIAGIYRNRDELNLKAGFIKYHVDHIRPLSKGGSHQLENLRIITAKLNQKKGSKFSENNF